MESTIVRNLEPESDPDGVRFDSDTGCVGEQLCDALKEDNIMENEQKAKLKENIREKIGAVKRDIASYKLLTQPIAPDSAIGRITRMEAINSKSINEAALKKAKDSLSGLERALSKIDTPDFGLCRECEEPIPFARLAILPETDHCVQCAENLSG